MLVYDLPRNDKVWSSPAEKALRVLAKNKLHKPAVYLFHMEKGRLQGD